jgi:acyl dehydratase
MNPSAEGTVYDEQAFTVDADRIRAFGEIFGQEEEGVPPTFATVAEFAAFPHVTGDPTLGLDFSRVVHGSQSYRYLRPLRAGESLTVRTWIESIKVRAGTGFLTIATDLVDAAGDLVATARSQMIERALDA